MGHNLGIVCHDYRLSAPSPLCELFQVSHLRASGTPGAQRALFGCVDVTASSGFSSVIQLSCRFHARINPSHVPPRLAIPSPVRNETLFRSNPTKRFAVSTLLPATQGIHRCPAYSAWGFMAVQPDGMPCSVRQGFASFGISGRPRLSSSSSCWALSKPLRARPSCWVVPD